MKSDLLDHVQHVIRGYKVSTAQHENYSIKYSNQNLYIHCTNANMYARAVQVLVGQKGLAYRKIIFGPPKVYEAKSLTHFYQPQNPTHFFHKFCLAYLKKKI